MWVRGAAIRPVPAYAVLQPSALEQVERELAREVEGARDIIDEALQRFEHDQPALSARIDDLLSRPMDEVAVALGHFLSVAIWLAFERVFRGRLRAVTPDGLLATEQAIGLEEELRARNANEPLDLDDIIALEQPGVLSFVHGHVEASLDAPDGSERDVDVDDVHRVYRTIVVMILALSHAVEADVGSIAGGEILA